jgi:hypothetical protein
VVDAVEASDLPPVARHLMVTLCGRLSGRGMDTGELGEHSPSLSLLADLTGWKPTPVKKYLGELERLDWLIRVQPPVELQRSKKARTSYTVRIPDEPPDLSALSRPPRDLDNDLSALSRSPDDHGLGRHATGARSPRGHTSDSQADQTLTRAADAIRAAVPGVTDDEIEAFIAKITPKCRTGNIAGFLAAFPAADIAAQITAMRTERKRAKQKADQTEIGKFREWARNQPPCGHGQPGGDLTDPAGIVLCPKCRRGLPAEDDEPLRRTS